MSVMAPSLDTRLWQEAVRWQLRSRDWELALRQLSLGGTFENRRAVATLRWLCQELERELGGVGAQPEAPRHSEDALSQLWLLLQGLRRELDRFRAEAQLGDLIPLGRALLSYLNALGELEAKGLFPTPADRTTLTA